MGVVIRVDAAHGTKSFGAIVLGCAIGYFAAVDASHVCVLSRRKVPPPRTSLARTSLAKC
jgi:hypothetical protein